MTANPRSILSNDGPVQYVLDVVYDVLYACASLEIFVVLIVILSTHGNRQTSSIVSISELNICRRSDISKNSTSPSPSNRPSPRHLSLLHPRLQRSLRDRIR